jgi:hypothetical protein
MGSTHVFNGIVNDVKRWHSGYNIEFTPAFTTKPESAFCLDFLMISA